MLHIESFIKKLKKNLKTRERKGEKVFQENEIQNEQIKSKMIKNMMICVMEM